MMKFKNYLVTWSWTTLVMYFLYDVVWLMADPEEFRLLVDSGLDILFLDLVYCSLFSAYNIGFGMLLLDSHKFKLLKKGKPIVFGTFFLVGNTLLSFAIDKVINVYMVPLEDNETWGNAYLMGLISSMQTLAIATDYYHKKAKRRQEEKQRLELQMLKLQLNPHFVFNSLSALSSLVCINPSQSERYIIRWSRIYRYILQHMDDELVTLDEAFDFTRDYINLLQLRYEHMELHREDFAYDSDECILRQSLQLLIENAVKHNAMGNEKKLIINIGRDKDMLTVSNNIIAPLYSVEATMPLRHLGLSNLAKRYLLNANREIKIDRTAHQFRVSLPIVKKNQAR